MPFSYALRSVKCTHWQKLTGITQITDQERNCQSSWASNTFLLCTCVLSLCISLLQLRKISNQIRLLGGFLRSSSYSVRIAQSTLSLAANVNTTSSCYLSPWHPSINLHSSICTRMHNHHTRKILQILRIVTKCGVMHLTGTTVINTRECFHHRTKSSVLPWVVWMCTFCCFCSCFPCWLEKHDVCRTPTQFNIAEVLWESPWLCWSVLLPGTRWCRRHRWGWAVCACWWTTSPTGCHSWPNALPYHSDWMRCPVAGPHAVLSDDHNSTWRRQESESGCKIGI